MATLEEAKDKCNADINCAGFHLNKEKELYQFKKSITKQTLQEHDNFTAYIKQVSKPGTARTTPATTTAAVTTPATTTPATTTPARTTAARTTPARTTAARTIAARVTPAITQHYADVAYTGEPVVNGQEVTRGAKWVTYSLANARANLDELHTAMNLYGVVFDANDDEYKNYCMLKVKLGNCVHNIGECAEPCPAPTSTITTSAPIVQNRNVSPSTYTIVTKSVQRENWLDSNNPTGQKMATLEEAKDKCNADINCAGFHLNKEKELYQFKKSITKQTLQEHDNFTAYIKN
jgi:hypothetical protein